MKRILIAVFLVIGIFIGPMIAGAQVFTLNQYQLTQLWQVYENPTAGGSDYLNQAYSAGDASGYISNPDGSVEYVGSLADTGSTNPYSPFAQMQIGTNFWGVSGATGKTGPTVFDLGVNDLTGYDTFALGFMNTNDDNWWVNLYMNTGWTDSPYNEPDNYYENGWKELAPGESALLSIDLTSVAYLDHVSNIGFNIGGNLDMADGNPSNPDTFHVTVNPVPEPATMLLLGSGLVGLAGFGRKKFFKKR